MKKSTHLPPPQQRQSVGGDTKGSQEKGWGSLGVPLETTALLLWGTELTLKDAYSSLGSYPRYGRILPQVIPSGIVARPALICPRVFQGKTSDSQHAHAIHPVGRVNGDTALSSAIPQLFERFSPVDFCVPPLDLWGGVPNHVTIQFKGVPCELSLWHRRLDKPS